MYKSPKDFMNYVDSKNPGEKEFLQAVKEVSPGVFFFNDDQQAPCKKIFKRSKPELIFIDLLLENDNAIDAIEKSLYFFASLANCTVPQAVSLDNPIYLIFPSFLRSYNSLTTSSIFSRSTLLSWLVGS